ncbi:MAG: DUF58 domain-containing protein [Lachnospiraceae bacterium]|nr:DUF58 domain-containing protein [Lachnospiraceae bacterium]
MKIYIHKKALIIYLIILVAGIIFASYVGGPVSYDLLYALLLVVPVSVLYIMLNYRFISIFQEIDVHRISKGEDYMYHAILENSGILPIHELKLGVYDDRCRLYEIDDGKKVSLEAREKAELVSKINCKFAGAYNVGLDTISFTDPFNIYSIKFVVPYSFRAIVSPRITDVAEKALDLENFHNSTGLKSTSMSEEIPSGNIRSYTRGDPISSINWKVSARLSELMVKMPDPMERRMVSILMKAADVPEIDRDTEFLKRRDKFLEFAVSAAWHFGNQGVPVKIVYPAGKIKESIVDSNKSFLEFYSIVEDGILYNSEADVRDIENCLNDIRGREHDSDTWIIIREDYEKEEDFCTVFG